MKASVGDSCLLLMVMTAVELSSGLMLIWVHTHQTASGGSDNPRLGAEGIQAQKNRNGT
jgi:hypothetical protein